MDEADKPAARVLVVEDRAHVPRGHFATRFVDVAEGFVDLGCSVEVLTSSGWVHEGERPVSFPVRRYGRNMRALSRLGETFRTTRGLQRVAPAWRAYALARAARRRCDSAGEPRPVVVVVSDELDPLAAAAYAGPGRWLVNASSTPRPVRRSSTRRAARAEQRRRAAGGRLRVAAPDHDTCNAWRDVAPFLEPVTLPLAGARPRASVPDAKRRFGLSSDQPVALLFGTGHEGKDIDLVARVFGELPDWQLLVIGNVAQSFRARSGGRDPVVAGGYVDEPTRALAYSATDLVVLSLRPSFQARPGGLVDAVSFGVSVACADVAPAADLVRRFRLGAVFPPGDPDGLDRAVRAAPRRLEPLDLDRARRELSARAVAAAVLEALSEPHSTPPLPRP